MDFAVMGDLLGKFLKRELTVNDVLNWVNKQRYANNIPHECKEHFAKTIVHIMEGYLNGYGFGDFISGILNNDLLRAVGHADSCNKLMIPYYVVYLWNNAPSDLWNYKYLA